MAAKDDLKKEKEDLDKRTVVVVDRETAVEKIEADLFIRKNELDAREQALFEREQALDAHDEGLIFGELSETVTVDEETKAVCREMCKELGITAEHALACSFDRATDTVSILTAGGKCVRLRPGDKPPQLSAIEITGVNPELARRKPVVGKRR
jgi:phosphoserine phosphatase